MQAKTWPYGTTRQAKILDRRHAVVRGKAVELLVLQDDQGEGHILVGTRSRGQPGDTGTITFTTGGQTGGYWKFAKEPSDG